MRTYHEYTFGFPSGMPPEVMKQQREDIAFERFLSCILTPEQMQKREQMRLMEYAIQIVVDEIMEGTF